MALHLCVAKVAVRQRAVGENLQEQNTERPPASGVCMRGRQGPICMQAWQTMVRVVHASTHTSAAVVGVGKVLEVSGKASGAIHRTGK